jgi:hypothetical protein
MTDLDGNRQADLLFDLVDDIKIYFFVILSCLVRIRWKNKDIQFECIRTGSLDALCKIDPFAGSYAVDTGNNGNGGGFLASLISLRYSSTLLALE